MKEQLLNLVSETITDIVERIKYRAMHGHYRRPGCCKQSGQIYGHTIGVKVTLDYDLLCADGYVEVRGVKVRDLQVTDIDGGRDLTLLCRRAVQEQYN